MNPCFALKYIIPKSNDTVDLSMRKASVVLRALITEVYGLRVSSRSPEPEIKLESKVAAEYPNKAGLVADAAASHRSPSTQPAACVRCGQLASRASAPTQEQPRDSNRCAVCGWPLVAEIEKGCIRGNCSQRPYPRWFYDPERAATEYGESLTQFDRRAIFRAALSSPSPAHKVSE